MHALVVTAHPSASSLTHTMARMIREGLEDIGYGVELADLANEKFDPVFGAADFATFSDGAATPPDVLTEQVRLDRADHLVLVYPIYWWSMPALLKGWIDRVFIAGWAFDEEADGGIVKKLDRLRVHLVALGGADLKTYARRGYYGAMRLQIDQGIFDFCGAKVVTSDLIVAESADIALDYAERARSIVHRIHGKAPKLPR